MKYLLLILLPVVAFAQTKTPVDFQKWRWDDTTYSKQIGGSVRNYQRPDKLWAQIVNDFETEGDSVVFVDQSVLKARVNKNGVSTVALTWDDAEYTVTQKMLGLAWLKISTRQSQWIDSTMNWSGFSVDSNICKWTGVSPGVDYRVLKDDGRVAHGVFFKPAFLDSAVTLYDQREDSLDIALANVMIYTLSSNIDDADSALGDLPKRRLKDFGDYSFNLRDQRLRFPGSDTLPRVPVRQYWERRGTKIVCVEYVMMSHVKRVHEALPAATIWHNDSKTIDGATNTDDTYLHNGNPDKSYGAGSNINLQGGWVGLLRVRNVDTELGVGATISACVCSVYCSFYQEEIATSMYSVFKPWNEGAVDNVDPDDAAEGEGVATWNDWSNDDEEWTTAGCGSADDEGEDNSGDGTGADRKATAEDTETVNADDTWFAWDISSALAQAWYDGTKNEEGVLMVSANSSYNGFRTNESGLGNPPIWVFTYTTNGEEAVPSPRRRKLLTH